MSINLSNLEKQTVPKIKKFAEDQGIKLVQGLNKENLVKYIRGAIYERDNFPDRRARAKKIAFEELVPKSMDSNVDWFEHLSEKGWAVVPIQGWKEKFVTDFFNWIESFCPNFDQQDPLTWTTENLPVRAHGIFKNYMGHTEFQWKIRELCVDIFAQIFNCEPEDLLCSFDGGCFLPQAETKSNTHFNNWFHCDQPRDMKGFCSVQGIVNFVDNQENDGGLVLIEESKNHIEEYYKTHPTSGFVWGPADTNDSTLQGDKIKICAPPGHIILFDTRMFHCNVPPVNTDPSKFRMCTYVSMQPRTKAIKELEKRIEIYKKGRMTSHWCYGPWFKMLPENPHTYGKPYPKPKKVEIAKLNSLRKRLIGFD